MDIERDPPPNRRKYMIAGSAIVALLLATLALNKLRPAVPTIDRASAAFDTVRVGDMIRDVRGPGTLVPERVRMIVATTGGRVEELPVRPGATVEPGTAIVILSNTDVQLAALQVQQQLTQAYAGLAQLRNLQRQQRITQEGVVAQLRTQHLEAQRAARVIDTLEKRRLTSPNEAAAVRDRAQEYATRYQLEQRRMDEMRAADEEQVRLSLRQVEGLRSIAREQQNRASSMRVTAGEAGQLQSLGNPQLELGQWVNSGIELARVSQSGRLKAVLRIPEALARDVLPGQRVRIDMRGEIARGQVMSSDPVSRGGTVTVEVAIDGELPKGARADVAVDGAIEIDRLAQVLHVGRPAYGVAGSEVKLFKVIPNTGEAVRVDVLLGKASVDNVELRRGLARGDSVIISDMSIFLTERRVRLRGP